MAEFDAKSLIKDQVTLQIRIKQLRQLEWRLNLAVWLCKLAARIAWLDFELIQKIPLDPWLYYCGMCGREIAGYRPAYGEYLIIGCLHCRYQDLVIGAKDGPSYVGVEILLEQYVCECHFAEPYGFVPEAGCPIHDRSGNVD